MKTENVKAFCTGLLLCMATIGMTGCGNSSSGSASTTNGRLTSISDSQVVIEAFADDMKKMENVSGGAVSGSAMSGKPQDGEKPDQNMNSDSSSDKKEPPQGEQPASGGAVDGQQKPDDSQMPQGESKNYNISSKTKVYKQSGDSKTEISLDDVEIGDNISVVADGEDATEIVVQDGMPSGGAKLDDNAKQN